MRQAASRALLPDVEKIRAQEFLKTIGRPVRIAVALALVALFVWGIDPGFLHPQAVTGKVNAELITLRAPIEGYVELSPMRVGGYVGRDQIVGTVENRHGDHARERELQIELSLLQDRRTGAETELKNFIELQAHLKTEVDAFQAATLHSLDGRIHEVAARIQSAEAVLKNAQAQYARTAKLLQTSNATPAQYDLHKATMDAAASELTALRAEHVRLKSEYDAATEGVFIGDNFNNTPYSHQRWDELELRKVELERDLADTAARQTSLQQQIESEQRRRAEMLSATILAPKSGIAWRTNASNGEYVSAGAALAQIVDCERPFFDVQLGTRSLNRMSLGDPVKVAIDGYDTPLPGHISALRGGADIDPGRFALNLMPDRQEQVLWIIEIDWPAGQLDPAHGACPVGRSGEVVLTNEPLFSWLPWR